jgi:hypothetical protein
MSLHKSVIVTILKKFNEEELKELLLFIHFSTGSKSSSMKTAMSFLQSCAPAYDEFLCSKENFSKWVFRKNLTKDLDKEINRLVSELKDEIEKFIVCKYALKSRAQSHLALAEWYKANNLVQQLEKVFANMEIDIQEKQEVNPRELYWHYLNQKIDHHVNLKDSAQSFLLLSKLSEHLKKHLSIEASIADIGVANVNRILNERASEFIATNKIKNDFLDFAFDNETKFYEKQLRFVRQPDFALYSYLKNEIFNDKLLISDIDKTRCLIILGNNIKRIPEIKKPDEEHIALSELRLQIEERQSFGGINSGSFNDYILSLIDCNMFDKAKTFLRQNRKPIAGVSDMKNLISYYEALIKYREKQPEDALEILNCCYAAIDLHKIELPLLRVKIAYDLNEPALFSAYVNTLRKYISSKGSKQFNQIIVLQILAVTKYLSKLFKIKAKEKIKLALLKDKALVDGELVAKKFVLEKIEEKLLAV